MFFDVKMKFSDFFEFEFRFVMLCYRDAFSVFRIR